MPSRRQRRTRRFGLVASLAAAAAMPFLFGVAPASFAKVTQAFEIRTLSTRPDTVTGGNVLIEVAVPQNVPRQMAIVFANGTNITSTLHWDDATRTLTGLVSGLRLGANEIAAASNGNGNGRPSASLAITNYPITGPVFSGPHETPFKCETITFAFPDGSHPLGAPLDADCSVATRVDFFYRSATNTWRPLQSLTSYPADLVTTTTIEGKSVPFIIRLETGTVNRAIYQTAMLDDPKNNGMPGLFQRSEGWNGRLVFQFGGGCTGGWYRQGSSTGGVTDAVILGMGYAMASSSLNVFGNNCSDLLASETLMMTKERFVETYGVPTYTIGFGCSGGSYQQHQAADNYPGLLDGIIPGCSFPEVNFATVHAITDARLIGNYFLNTAMIPWSDEQKRQVVGFFGLITMTTSTVYDGALRVSPTGFCPSVLPPSERYNALNNPAGARCDVYDHAVNVFGRDPITHFALRPLDNVGIQYGLAALKRGTISMDQFLDLNEKVGGYDFDGNFKTSRTVADLPAVRAAYRSGRLTNGGGGLRDIPIIDYRAYADDDPLGNIHLRYHSFSMRERLKKANGDADNQVMLVEDMRYGLYSSTSPLLQFALREMDAWIANIRADDAEIPQHRKIVRDKPADLVEGCNSRAPVPTFIVEKQTRDPNLLCEMLYPSAPAPREVAGASVASDIIKCELRPINLGDYPGTPTAAQVSRLQNIFPNGVCDWTVPGVEQRPFAGTWQFF
jgi:uncharacterized tannase-like protein DUF6351